MPLRTKLFQQLPWVGGVNTSVDDSMIPPNQLVQADNVIFDFRGTRKKRESIKFNFDDRALSDNNEYGLFEFWFGISSRQKKFVSANGGKEIHSYSTGGISTLIGDNGFPWTGITDQFSFLTFNNKLFIATTGNNNTIKQWDGSSPTVQDVINRYGHTSTFRSSLGTTRTIVLDSTFKGLNGDIIVVSGATGPNAAFYNGSRSVTTIFTTSATNDTITFEDPTLLTEAPTADTTIQINGTAPLGSIMREHLGRIWTNDKTNKDRVQYSGTNNHEQWLGFGDSAALDIGIGDGDPEGITAIFPSFKGELFVAKRTKLYRISGYSPETFVVSMVSSGIGCIAHNSIVQVDQDDMFFVSEKGIHSIAASANFGDFNSTYISADIQKTFNENFSKSRLKYVQGGYLPTVNSIVFAFTDTNLPEAVNNTLTVNNSLWFYNVQFKVWFRWPDIPCQALMVATDGDKKRLYFGTHTGRILKSFTGGNSDISYDGIKTPIKFKCITGQISLDDNIYTVKGFKRFILYYKPQGIDPVTITVQIDNIDQDPVNVLVYNEIALGVLLGIDFILGESVLGFNARLAAYTRSMDGFGHSCKLVIDENGDQPLEIQGFGIEYEDAGTAPEVILR